MIYYC
jgi:hypothetical protein